MPAFQAEPIRVRKEYGGWWYKPKDSEAEGWLCTALLRYLDTAPESLYIKAELGLGRYVSTELQALRERIEKLDQLVGKLTL